MLQRCENPNDDNYSNYGGCGVAVAPRWQRFDNFLADMGERPAGKSLDRYPNPDGNYEPHNCRWATPKEQSNNRRNNHILELNGQRHTITEWSAIVGMPATTLFNRLNSGWTVEQVLTTAKQDKSVILEFRSERHNLTEWSAILGVPARTLLNRLEYGWSVDRILTQPSRPRHIVVLDFRGEKHSLAKWANILGLARTTLVSRIKMGWSIERAFKEPV
jgi:hypothetical protein